MAHSYNARQQQDMQQYMGVLRVDAEREKPDTKSTYGTVSFVKGQKQAKLVMREIRVTPAWGMGWWGLDLGSGCAGLETQTNPLPTIQRLLSLIHI